MPKIPDLEKLWSHYPKGESVAVKAELGGAIDASWITNTCAIRMSHALNEEGTLVVPASFAFKGGYPPKLNTIKGGNGKRYAYRVAELMRFLQDKLGKPTLDVAKERDAEMPKVFEGRSGIIIFNDCGWSDATGHVDLWNGIECVNHAYWHEAKRVLLWEPPKKLAVSSTHGEEKAVTFVLEFATVRVEGRAAANDPTAENDPPGSLDA